MALKALMLRRSIDKKKAELEELRNKDADFATREAELEESIGEAETAEQEAAVSEAVDQYEADKAAHEDAKAKLTAEIEELERDLTKEEENAPKPEDHQNEERTDYSMNTRTKFFGMTVQERSAFFARSDVKDFIQRVRDLGHQKRAITGSDLLIPEVVLGLIRENIQNYSKLYKHVNVRSVPGKARQTIMGTIPEAVWTEMCGKLNELGLTFNAVEVDGYKVGGYIAVCNALLEDSDISLGTEIISAIGQGIGYALDKAILYGTGTKMPLGIVTRLAQTTKPTGYPTNAPAWVDLHTSNLLAITGKTDAALFKAMVEASGAAKGKYSSGTKFWAMNEATYTKLVSNAMSINAAGAIVTGMNKTFPVIGGDI